MVLLPLPVVTDVSVSAVDEAKAVVPTNVFTLSHTRDFTYLLFLALWDGQNKKKLTTLPKMPTSISALAFNRDGQELAIASSYTFEDGEREHPHDEIYVRKMLDSECKPKTAK